MSHRGYWSRAGFHERHSFGDAEDCRDLLNGQFRWLEGHAVRKRRDRENIGLEMTTWLRVILFLGFESTPRLASTCVQLWETFRRIKNNYDAGTVEVRTVSTSGFLDEETIACLRVAAFCYQLFEK